MNDVWNEGYVGVSYDPKHRFLSHKNKSDKLVVNRDFSNKLSRDLLEQLILFKGTRRECLLYEKRLRPSTKIGWNTAVGGNGGNPRHGLQGDTKYIRYISMLSRARSSESLTVSDSLLEDEGIFGFIALATKADSLGLEVRLPPSGEVSLDTLVLSTRSEINSMRKKKNYDLGSFESISEMSRCLGIKENTISTRLKRGWKIDEVVRGEKQPRLYRGVKYNGRLSDEDLDRMMSLIGSGESVFVVGKVVGLDPSFVNRLYRKFEGGK